MGAVCGAKVRDNGESRGKAREENTAINKNGSHGVTEGKTHTSKAVRTHHIGFCVGKWGWVALEDTICDVAILECSAIPTGTSEQKHLYLLPHCTKYHRI